MSNSKLPLRPITPKLQELAQDSSIITVVTFPQLEIQEITIPTTNTSIIITTTKVIKKNNRYRVDSYEKETGQDDANTGLLLSFLKDNFDIYRKNKSNFTKTAVAKIFSEKAWEQIKNKLACLINKYNEIKEKENKTGRDIQAK